MGEGEALNLMRSREVPGCRQQAEINLSLATNLLANSVTQQLP
ncbi:hypothetical protein [Allocoleopsis sp.]